ncbi:MULTISPECIES: hypothetical protein [unclassified Bradyrhizobium]|jgi:hypothetical protein|uniref:hypothetical protein n=1 Tax=unclassified Bradyrhizobium TaxID=2631580 RepID=UPI00070EA2EF|nr:MULTISPECIES: hypothetical protein [unclassified Bradyrhizobium]KQT20758.1 hypothetical protein ASG57_27250 [Bradyrhizobium sp. Leaf396]
MRRISILFAAAAGLTLAMTAAGTVHAQGMESSMERGMMHGASDHAQCMSMMRDRMGNMGSGMMDQRMGGGMMGGGMMGSSAGGMMMDRDMMGGGGARSGMGALFGSRVTPVMNLSIDDVRGYLDMQLNRLDNKRLKIGDVKSDDANITADIVTLDNSLVQRLKVDRHTGAIEYES